MFEGRGQERKAACYPQVSQLNGGVCETLRQSDASSTKGLRLFGCLHVQA